MGFESEAAMKEVALEVPWSDLTHGPTTVVDEFSYGAGRTDIVLAKESQAYRGHRLDTLGIDAVIDDDSHLRSFLLLHNRDAVSKEYFFELGALSRSSKEESLNWLISNGFVNELSDGKIQTAPHLRRHITRSYSIELKLDKWRDALKQAFRAKSFSDYQFVALDDENIIRAIDNLEVFEEYGVGLIAIRDDCDYAIHHNPERDRPYSPINMWRLNERTIWEERHTFSYSD